MAAANTRTTSTTVQGTGSLEQDGEMAPLAFEWKSTTTEGVTAVTLEVVREVAALTAVYRGTLEGVADAATFDALAHMELLFSYSHDLNHFTVMGDHEALSNGLRLSIPQIPVPPPLPIRPCMCVYVPFFIVNLQYSSSEAAFLP
jgi:hypothetical protein